MNQYILAFISILPIINACTLASSNEGSGARIFKCDQQAQCDQQVNNFTVCGFQQNQVKQFQNSCVACAENATYGYQEGNCTQEIQDYFTNGDIGVCDPNNRPNTCDLSAAIPGYCGAPQEIAPCGQLFTQFGNKCSACADNNTYFYVRGDCWQPNNNTNNTNENPRVNFSKQIGINIIGFIFVLSLIA